MSQELSGLRDRETPEVIGPLPLDIPLLREKPGGEGAVEVHTMRIHFESTFSQLSQTLCVREMAAAYGPSGTVRSCGCCCTPPSTARRAAAVRLQEITKV